MKKILFSIILGLAIASLLGGCEDFNDQFEGLDTKARPTNITKYVYSMVNDDYKVIGDAVQKPIANQIKTKQDAIKLEQAALKNAANHADSAVILANIAAINSEIAALKLDPTYILGGQITANKYLWNSTPSTDFIPLFLTARYPYGDVGTSASITYNYNPNDLAYLSNFTGATGYTVKDADYLSLGGKIAKAGCFTPSLLAERYIPTFLNTAITSPTEGKYALVTYKSSDIEPALADIPSITTVFSDDFGNGDLDNFISYSVSGAQVWGIDATHGVSGTACAKISGYSGGSLANEDWLIIPSINLSIAKAATLSFQSAYNYAGNNLVLKYSTNYLGSGNPTVATWTTLTYTKAPEPGSWVWTPSGNINIPGMPNSNVSIAFVYTSDITQSRTWELDNVVLTYKDSDADVPYKTYNDFYKYSNAKWAKATDGICVQPFEYALMGTATGTPGASNYFSSTIPPASYLPTYLKNKYPLAFEGDVRVVAYNYSSATTLRADEYRYKSGAWTAYSGLVSKTDPFVYSTIGWVFDPTVKLDMISADYKLMVDYVLATPEIAIFAHPYYKNEEYYYGFNNRYSNINFRLSYRNPYFTGAYIQPATIDPELSSLTTTESKVALMWSRLEKGMGIFLQLRFPEAIPQVNGVDVNYVISTKVYYPDGVTNVTDTYRYTFKCTGAGAPPTFEFVSKEKVN